MQRSANKETVHQLLQALAVGRVVRRAFGDQVRPAGQFGVDGRVGLSEVLSGDVFLADALITLEDGLVLLPAGRTPPNPSEQLGSSRMRELLEALSETHMILVDAPPVLPLGDGVSPVGAHAASPSASVAVENTSKGPARSSACTPA